RAQMGVAPSTYPLSGYETKLSRPLWFHDDFQGADIDSSLPMKETGDIATRHPGNDFTVGAEEIETLRDELFATQVANAPAWVAETAYLEGATVKLSSGERLKATEGG